MNSRAKSDNPVELTSEERIFYRDKLREARYAALADSEAFEDICFAIESLGARLSTKNLIGLNDYKPNLKKLSEKSLLYKGLISGHSYLFSNFDILFERLKSARNDMMHTGAFARNATNYSIELCTILEDAIMQDPVQPENKTVAFYMVKSPVVAELWHPLGYVRQKMLAHSFSYLPIYISESSEWKLISDICIIKITRNISETKRREIMRMTIGELIKQNQLDLKCTKPIEISTPINSLDLTKNQGLWLIQKDQHLVGIISPFELL